MSLFTLSNMVVPCHMWLFKLKLVLYKTKDSVSQLCQSYFKCLIAACGQWLPHWTVKIQMSIAGGCSIGQCWFKLFVSNFPPRNLLERNNQTNEPRNMTKISPESLFIEQKNQTQTKPHVFIKNQVAINIHDIQINKNIFIVESFHLFGQIA